MKKATFRALLGGILVCAASIAQAAQPAVPKAAPVSSADIFLSSNGVTFCDYFQVNLTGVLVYGTHNLNTFCGVPNALISGNANVASGTPPYNSIPAAAYNISSTADAPGANLFYLFDASTYTWANYYWDGSSFLILHIGTYTVGPYGARVPAAGAPRSTVQ